MRRISIVMVVAVLLSDMPAWGDPNVIDAADPAAWQELRISVDRGAGAGGRTK